MSSLHIGLSGSTGRMGQELKKLLSNSNHIVAAELSKKTLLNSIGCADVWIDFSSPEATLRLLEVVQSPLVIGTTGFADLQLLKIHEFSKKHPVLMSGNMSFGVEFVRRIISGLPSLDQAEVSIIEEHHRHKKDSPSGTAKLLKDALIASGFSDVPIHSVREGDTFGVHQVRWVTGSESIEIIHRAHDRTLFAKGALVAAEWIVGKVPGLYRTEHIWENE